MNIPMKILGRIIKDIGVTIECVAEGLEENFEKCRGCVLYDDTRYVCKFKEMAHEIVENPKIEITVEDGMILVNGYVFGFLDQYLD